MRTNDSTPRSNARRVHVVCRGRGLVQGGGVCGPKPCRPAVHLRQRRQRVGAVAAVAAGCVAGAGAGAGAAVATADAAPRRRRVRVGRRGRARAGLPRAPLPWLPHHHILGPGDAGGPPRVQHRARLLLQRHAHALWLQHEHVDENEARALVQPDDAERLLRADAAVGQDQVLQRDAVARRQLHAVCVCVCGRGRWAACAGYASGVGSVVCHTRKQSAGACEDAHMHAAQICTHQLPAARHMRAPVSWLQSNTMRGPRGSLKMVMLRSCVCVCGVCVCVCVCVCVHTCVSVWPVSSALAVSGKRLGGLGQATPCLSATATP
jgi:hypothetical protein